MARFDNSFDATGIEPAAGYDVLPAGKYVAQIIESEMRVTSNGMGQFLWLMLDILEGPYKGRKVFDGVWPHVAGAGRGSFNHRFGQPSRDGNVTQRALALFT